MRRMDERGVRQRGEGKEDLLQRGWRRGREFKELVDEAREVVREEEERKEGKKVGVDVGDGEGRKGQVAGGEHC